MNSEKSKRYFAAANTGEGFKSYFEEIFFSPSVIKRYIIKGGPGTGKSSFMKRVALHAASKGHEVEYYYCSSDTRSLDGIKIDGKFAIFDGTAPHSYDTALAGVRDEIINLGDFWDSDMLSHEAESILRLTGEKKEAYTSAYAYLGAAHASEAIARRISNRFINEPKMNAAVERIYTRVRTENDMGDVETKQCSALGIHGFERLDTLEKLASSHWQIIDFYGTAKLFLTHLLELAQRDGVSCVVSRNIIDTSIPTEIYFPCVGTWLGVSDADFSDSDQNARVINMKRFVLQERLSECRGEYRAVNKICEDIAVLAVNSLTKAGKAHAELEKYYVKSMDFSRQSEFCTRFIEKLKF